MSIYLVWKLVHIMSHYEVHECDEDKLSKSREWRSKWRWSNVRTQEWWIENVRCVGPIFFIFFLFFSVLSFSSPPFFYAFLYVSFIFWRVIWWWLNKSLKCPNVLLLETYKQLLDTKVWNQIDYDRRKYFLRNIDLILITFSYNFR